MKRTLKPTKLTVHRQTVRALERTTLDAVNGGRPLTEDWCVTIGTPCQKTYSALC